MRTPVRGSIKPAKVKKLRRYRVVGVTKLGGFKRVHTLSACNKIEAGKLVLNQYTPKGKPKVTCLK